MVLVRLVWRIGETYRGSSFSTDVERLINSSEISKFNLNKFDNFGMSWKWWERGIWKGPSPRQLRLLVHGEWDEMMTCSSSAVYADEYQRKSRLLTSFCLTLELTTHSAPCSLPAPPRSAQRCMRLHHSSRTSSRCPLRLHQVQSSQLGSLSLSVSSNQTPACTALEELIMLMFT